VLLLLSLYGRTPHLFVVPVDGGVVICLLFLTNLLPL